MGKIEKSITVNYEVLQKRFQPEMLTNIVSFLRRNVNNFANLFFYTNAKNKTIVINETGCRDDLKLGHFQKYHSFAFYVEGTTNEATVELYIPYEPYELSCIQFGIAITGCGSLQDVLNAMLSKLDQYLKLPK